MLTSATLELTETQQRALDKLPPRVAEALSQFVERLLARFGEQIHRIILYGSFARGDAHAGSDVDVMVVVRWRLARFPDGALHLLSGDPRCVEIRSIADDATLQHGAFVSDTIVDEELFVTGRDAIREARREGLEMYHHPSLNAFEREKPRPPRVLKETDSGVIYAIEPDDERDIRQWLARAEKELEVARYLSEGGFHRDSFSSTYYAMFYAAKAALLAAGVYVKSYAGAISEFGRMFATTGRVPGELSRLLSQRFKQRLESDYELDFSPSRREAEQAILDAESFVAKARELVEDELSRRGGAVS
jgi:uncharacterized protein (UPF0332 family)